MSKYVNRAIGLYDRLLKTTAEIDLLETQIKEKERTLPGIAELEVEAAEVSKQMEELPKPAYLFSNGPLISLEEFKEILLQDFPTMSYNQRHLQYHTELYRLEKKLNLIKEDISFKIASASHDWPEPSILSTLKTMRLGLVIELNSMLAKPS